MVDVESQEWKQTCDIIDRLEGFDTNTLCDVIRMLCANSDVAKDCLLGQYGDILDEFDDE